MTHLELGLNFLLDEVLPLLCKGVCAALAVRMKRLRVPCRSCTGVKALSGLLDPDAPGVSDGAAAIPPSYRFGV